MHALCVGATVRPAGLVSHPSVNDGASRRRDRITARASRPDDDLERLESFFGTSDGYTGRRHHRRGHWVDDEYVHVPADEAEAPAEQVAAPVLEAPAPPAEARASALVDQLSSMTAEQLANLQVASKHAAEALREGAGAVRGQAGRLATTVQHQAEEAQAALSRTADSLKQRMDSGRTASTAPAAPAAAPPPAAARRNKYATPVAPSTAQATPSIREQFRTEVNQGLDYLRSLSEQQLRNLEAAARSVRSGVASTADQLQAMVPRKTGSEAVAPPSSKQQKPQQQAKQQAKKKDGAAAPTAEAHPLTSWAAALRERLPSVSVSVPAPLASLPGEAERLRASLAANPWAAAVGGAALALTALRRVGLSSRRRGQMAEQEARSRAISRRALDRQRARFKSALDGSEDDDADSAGIDTSVFAAVKQIRTTAAASAAATAAAAAGDSEEEEEEGMAAMDPEMRRQWEAFVKGSRLSDAEMWDPEEVDEGLPEVYVSFDEEDEE